MAYFNGTPLKIFLNTSFTDFEKRFFFHDVKEFPKPEKNSIGKKTYPSQAIAESKCQILVSIFCLLVCFDA